MNDYYLWRKKSSQPVYVIDVASKQDGASPAFLLEGVHRYLDLPDQTSHCMRLNPSVRQKLGTGGQHPSLCRVV